MTTTPPCQLIATDIDGTLLRSDGTVSDRARRAIADVEDSGRLFVLVTGRPPRWLRPITEQVAHRGLAICANGGIVMDLHTEEVVRVDAFPDGVGLDVLNRLRAMDDTLTFGVEWADGFAHEASYPRGTRSSELARGAAQDVGHVDELFARPVVKVLARAQDRGRLALDELAERAIAEIGELATVTWSSVGLLEVSAPAVTKAAALHRFAEDHGLGAEDVLAFGDMPNDLPMIEWAGHGVAVANAHQMVREVADEVTDSNDDDGVAKVIERVLG